MATGRITVFRSIPGSTSLGPILRDFGKHSAGIVTAFSDSLLPMCRQIVGEDFALEVVPFGEVVRNFLVLCGEEALPIAQSGHTQAAISYSCGQIDETSPFYKSSQFEGFHDAVSQTLDDLRHWGLNADEMEALIDRVQPRLANKLRTLAELDRGVEEILSMLGRQLHTKQLMSSFDSTPELEGDLDRILVIVGSEESPLRIQWIKWLADQGIDVTVVLDRHATDAPIFAGADHAIDLLGAQPTDRGDGNRLTRNLFSGEPQDGPKIGVAIVSAADPLAEAEWALRGCLTSDRIDRVGIYVRDLETYAPLIESVAKRFEIPIRMARRAPLLTNSFARLTLTALKFCASNDVRTLSPVLRSSYLHLSGATQNGLNTQLRTCFVARSQQWSTLEAWVIENAESHVWLVALLEWRRTMLQGGIELNEWLGLFKKMSEDQRLPWVAQENKGGIMDKRDLRAYHQMGRLLASYASVDRVTARSSMNLKEFVELCERLWSAGDVSIPTDEVGVRVTADPHVIGDVEQLYVLGMLEGVFPRRRSEDPVLTDDERAEISRLRPDHAPLPDSRTKAQAERDEFYRVCAAAGDRIVFSYPLADDQKDNIPAFYLSEVERAAGTVEKRNHPRPQLAPSISECVASADLRLRLAADGPRETPLPIELVSETAISAVRPPIGAAFEPRVLRDVFECPFKYFASNVLHLRPKRPSTRWHSLRKLPVVSQLLSKGDMDEAERAMIVALNSELDQLYADVPDWEMQLLRSGGQRLIRDWLHREARSREEWSKDPGSTKANVSFGSHGVRDMMPGEVRLEGAIPGISRLENYNVAHLYGSSLNDSKKLTETQKLYYGLHLMAIHEPGREGALEIESMSGKRTLMVMGRSGSGPLASSVADGLQVIDLASDDDVRRSKFIFYEEVKKALLEAVRRIYDVRVDAQKGEHCDYCDFGELCRRSRGYGEDESPFGADTEFEDV